MCDSNCCCLLDILTDGQIYVHSVVPDDARYPFGFIYVHNNHPRPVTVQETRSLNICVHMATILIEQRDAERNNLTWLYVRDVCTTN
ncbi:hypothetical protein EVAR_67531_1 [Eumeta japonica]|uniref:Uncharacterized protein n=1 Tax=Eumeta variegata TaxID=151549 RepID=A0A4C1YZJ7_EUMVA|nr:hypothetical protein EVAR_67531_1 [Eumeta japonica]